MVRWHQLCLAQSASKFPVLCSSQGGVSPTFIHCCSSDQGCLVIAADLQNLATGLYKMDLLVGERIFTLVYCNSNSHELCSPFLLQASSHFCPPLCFYSYVTPPPSHVGSCEVSPLPWARNFAIWVCQGTDRAPSTLKRSSILCLPVHFLLHVCIQRSAPKAL